jgi:hypothetical protein
MAVRHPEIYPTFLDFSGESHPTLGDRARTLNPAFGGDQAAFDRVDPLTILRSRRFPDSEGVIATGGDDREAPGSPNASLTGSPIIGRDT